MPEAVIFDMDGLLVDTEPVWRRAEVAVLRPLGVPITEELCELTMGLRVDEVVGFWHAQYPWTSPSVDDVATDVVDQVEAMLGSVEPLPGACESVRAARAKAAYVALASSSSMRLISAVLRSLGLSDVFDIVHSAETEPYGKPHPAVYLSAADQLGVRADRCLAVEDSVNGLIAAKAARMSCIVVPTRHEPRVELFTLADDRLASLWELESALQRLDRAEA